MTQIKFYNSRSDELHERHCKEPTSKILGKKSPG